MGNLATAIYNNAEYHLTVSIGGGGGGGGGSDYYISGSSSLRYGSTAKYSLYYNGSKLSNVSWSIGSYLRSSVSSGVLTVTPTSRPVTTFKTAVYALVSGKRVGSKSITITR